MIKSILFGLGIITLIVIVLLLLIFILGAVYTVIDYLIDVYVRKLTYIRRKTFWDIMENCDTVVSWLTVILPIAFVAWLVGETFS